jgi:hypothetical protein
MLRRVTVLRYKLGFKCGLFRVWYGDCYNIVHLYLQLFYHVFTTQAQIVQHWHASFDDQLVHLYTRKVYLEYR